MAAPELLKRKRAVSSKVSPSKVVVAEKVVGAVIVKRNRSASVDDEIVPEIWFSGLPATSPAP